MNAAYMHTSISVSAEVASLEATEGYVEWQQGIRYQVADAIRGTTICTSAPKSSGHVLDTGG